MSAFFDMGGYGLYVWSSFAISALVIAYNLILPHWQSQRVLKKLAQTLTEEQVR